MEEAKVRFQKVTAAYERLIEQNDISDDEDGIDMFATDETYMDRAAEFFRFM